MRNLIVATEGHRESAFSNISLEEEASLIAEATAEQASLDTDLGEADRLADMSDALEDLAVQVDGIEGEQGDGVPTESEANLIDTVANAAVAGTDVESEEIVPAMEAAGGKRRYSAESIRERARSIWEAIKRILKQVWEKITSFMYKIFGTIPSLRRRIVELKERVRDNSSKTIEEKKITISSGVASLSANYKPPSNAGELRKHYLDLLNVDKEVFGEQIDQNIRIGEAVLSGLEDFDAEKAQESAEKFVEKVKKAITTGSKIKTTGVSGNRFGDTVDAKMTDPLLGNVSIVVKKPTFIEHKSGQGQAGSVLGVLEAMRGYAVEVVQTSEKAKDVPNNFEMSTATNSEMTHLLDDSLEILDILEKFQKGKRADEAKKLKGKLETASDKAATAMKKLEGKEDVAERAAVPYYRGVLNYNQAYARWIKDPALPMVSHSLASIRAVMTVVQKSLANYKTA